MSKLFEKLAAEENKFFTSQFLAPVLKGKPIRVRIASTTLTLPVAEPTNFQGWGVFDLEKYSDITIEPAKVSKKLNESLLRHGTKESVKKISDLGVEYYMFRYKFINNKFVSEHKGKLDASVHTYNAARFVREPNMKERQSYLNLFPVLRLILCRKQGNQWLGIPANQADTRFRVSGLAPVQLAEEVQLFEVVQTRFDGTTCWFDSIDEANSPRKAVYLRESLTTLVEPDKVLLSGLTQEEKDAYLMAYGPALEADIEAKKDKQEERIKLALFKAGARYQSYIERGNTFTVEYVVDGERHKSVVDKETLGVQSAGICLSGNDKMFDLQTLVGVIRNGIRQHRIVRVGNNYGDHNYGSYDDQDDW